MAYPRACLMLLLLSAYSCSRALHATALSFSYDFSKPGDLDSAHLTYMEDSSNSGDRVSLTKMTTESTGRVAYPQRVRLWDKRTGKRASFTTTFSFAINDVASNGSTTTTYGNGGRGDGMAFFVGNPGLPPDSGGGHLGLFSNNSNNPSSSAGIFGVEFDTFKNSGFDPPDITADHIGIDINNISSTNYTVLPNLALSGTMLANITYDGGSKIMSVSLWVGDGRSRPPYSVRTQVDLRDAGVPREAAVGFSAATGGLVESHQLLSWSFSSTDPSKTELWVVILIALASASLACLVAALLCLLIRGQRQALPMPKPKIELTVAREFSYRELSTATKNFSGDRKLGEGSFGQVYRGELRDPRMPPVAVKRLTTLLEHTRKDYVTEIMTLGQLSHRNLVKLVGWCDDDNGGSDKLLLVYELVSNRSLDEHLHRSDMLLPWPARYKIVLGIGSAIEYLHTGYRNPILHRDIKPSNVMLDDDFVAKLGDFGLVRQVQPDQASLNDTVMVGSWDYMDPMCIITGTASTASDMYSFGVLLLEVATGKRPHVKHDDEKGDLPNILVNAVREYYGKGAVLDMADPRLNGDFDENQMERVMLVGLFCAHKNRRNRLGIREAVNLLSNLKHPLPESEVKNKTRRKRLGIREAVDLLSNLKHPSAEPEVVATRNEARQK